VSCAFARVDVHSDSLSFSRRRVVFRTCRPIKRREERLVDYGPEYWGYWDMYGDVAKCIQVAVRDESRKRRLAERRSARGVQKLRQLESHACPLNQLHAAAVVPLQRLSRDELVARELVLAQAKAVLEGQFQEVRVMLHERTMCVLWLTHPVLIVFLPCGHQKTCSDCSDRLEKCPLCQAEIEKRITPFR
jgi:hypothetical protein